MRRPADTTPREWRAVRRIVRRAAREQRKYDELRDALGAVAHAAFAAGLGMGALSAGFRDLQHATANLRATIWAEQFR